MNILVIGGSNIDVYGLIPGPLKMKDSNLGKIYTSPGGVGRNILENLARLQLKPRFVTAIGNDHNGHDLINQLTALGVETQTLIVEKQITPTYLAILDSERDMLIAVNDMDTLKSLDVRFLKETPTVAKWIKEADCIVADTNLEATVLAYLAEEVKKPLYVDAISSTKAMKLVPLLNHITVLKCSRREAEALAGISVSSQPIEKIGRSILEKGVGELFLTDGANGSYSFKGKTIAHHRAFPVEVVSTSGAGDAFFSGVIYAKAHNLDALKYGSAAAKLTLQSPLTNSPLLSPQVLGQILLEYGEK